MRFKKAHAGILVERALLKINSGGVNMRGGNADAVCVEVLCADGEEKEVLASVVVVIFSAANNLIAERVGNKAFLFCHANALGNGFAFGFCCIQEGSVALCVVISLVYDLGRCLFVYGFFLVKKIFCV